MPWYSRLTLLFSALTVSALTTSAQGIQRSAITCAGMSVHGTVMVQVSIGQAASATTNRQGFIQPMDRIPEIPVTPLIAQPNPTQRWLTISTLEPGDHISLYNALGQVVFEAITQSESINLDLNPLREGVYIVRCQGQRIYGSVNIVKVN